MTRLILIRHGETDRNAEGKMHQNKDETGLNKKGQYQIAKTAKELEKYAPSVIYSSRKVVG